MGLANRDNIRQYKKPLKFNMGIFIFGMVFLYFLAFGIFRFIKNGNVSSYVVNSGSLSDNTTFTAFAIRNEEVFTANKGGEIQLYAREGSKISYGETVYTLDESGYLKSVLQNLSSESSNLSDDDFKYLQGLMSTFKQGYNSSDFSKVYDFKMSMESDILDSLNLSALSNTSIDTSKFEINKATEPGIIVYSYDGYEDVTIDSFTKEMVNNHKLKKTSTRGVKEVNSGDTVYKLITDENWYLVMAIDDSFEEKIKDKKSIQIRFIDDSQFAWVNFEIINREDQKFLALKLPNSAVRYATERYIKIEVQTSGKTGLKVPKSAIVEKELYAIPKEFITQGGSSGGNGVLKETGSSMVEFVDVRIVSSDDENYYVEKSALESGVRIRKPEAQSTYTIGATKSVPGVFNINKGFAVFVTVDILDENKEYAIIASNSKYGVKKYDYIVLDGKSVKEDEIIH